MGNKTNKDFVPTIFNLNNFSLKFKNIFLYLTRAFFSYFFKWLNSQRCLNVAQHCEN